MAELKIAGMEKIRLPAQIDAITIVVVANTRIIVEIAPYWGLRKKRT